MVDPFNLDKKSSWTDFELEEFLIFCMFVAGKRADIVADKTDCFVQEAKSLDITPFDWLSRQSDEQLLLRLKEYKIGRYKTFVLGLRSLSAFKGSLRTVSVEELEKVPGISVKTSRFFKTYTDPDFVGFVPDTHLKSFISNFTRNQDFKSMERCYFSIIEALGVRHQDFDIMVWKIYKSKNENEKSDLINKIQSKGISCV